MVYCEHPKIHFLIPQKRTLEIKKMTYEGSIIISGMLRIVHANFCTNPLKLIYNIDFYSIKISFFSTLKSILKIKNCKKGLSSSYLTTIYYIHAKGQLPTMISFRSGGGGVRTFRVVLVFQSYLYICIKTDI